MISHDVAKKNIVLLLEDDRKLAENFMSSMERIEKEKKFDCYTEEYKKEFENRELQDMLSRNQARLDAMLESVKEIIDAETENENLFEITDPELQGALNLVNVLGEKLDIMTAGKLIVSLTGRYQALAMLRNVLEGNKIKYSDTYLPLFSRSSEKAKHIYSLVENMKLKPGNITQILELNAELLKLADVIGIELTEAEKGNGMTDEQYITYCVRPAMNL
ncbi:MAG: hypothetical protein ACI4CC_08640 [Lachnospiraceae bacterium]